MPSPSSVRLLTLLVILAPPIATSAWAIDDTTPESAPVSPGGSTTGKSDNPGSDREQAPQPREQAPTQKPVSDEFAEMDLDHDGRISASEYAAAPQSAIDRIAAGKQSGPAGITGGFDLANNEGHPERSRFFRRLDLNKDGYISREELAKARRSISEPPKR